MLLPPTFEVDHIVELCDGGKGEYSNLQALCPNCHALKTRANILRRDKAFKKEFGKRFDLMQTNSFKEFEYINLNNLSIFHRENILSLLLY